MCSMAYRPACLPAVYRRLLSMCVFRSPPLLAQLASGHKPCLLRIWQPNTPIHNLYAHIMQMIDSIFCQNLYYILNKAKK